MRVLYLVFLLFLNFAKSSVGISETEKAREFLKIVNEKWANIQHKNQIALWNFNNNMTRENLAQYLEVRKETGKLLRNLRNDIVSYRFGNLESESLRRQFKLFPFELGHFILSEEKSIELETVIQEMNYLYNHQTIEYEKKNYDVVEYFNEPRETMSPKKKVHLWRQYKKAGRPMRKYFTKYVSLLNEVARLYNLRDASDIWIQINELTDLRNQVKSLWNEIEPLYKQFHAYVRHKLAEKYSFIDPRGGIPSHLFEINRHDWMGLEDIVPYPEIEHINFEEDVAKQRFSTIGIYKTADDFINNLNFPEMPRDFWTKSIIYKSADGRVVNSYVAVENMYSKHDIRIRSLMPVNQHFFFEAHFLLTVAYAKLVASDQPYIFQHEPITGLYSAIANALLLQIKTAKHLRKIGLVKSKQDKREIINNMFYIALNTLKIIPYAYLADLWRWNIFTGATPEENYNCAWWNLRFTYEGVEPPENRSEEDFDPGARSHMLNDEQYLPHFIAAILQFQIYKALCIEVGDYNANKQDSIFNCDMYGSREVGNILKETLQFGRSKTYKDILENFIGSRTISAKALLEYFRPLYEWLQKENRANGAYIGWDKPTTSCHPR